MSNKENKSVEELLQSLKVSLANNTNKEIVEEKVDDKKSINKEEKGIVIADVIKEMVSRRIEEVFEDEIEQYFSKNSSEIRNNLVNTLEQILEKKPSWMEVLIKEAIEKRLDKIIG